MKKMIISVLILLFVVAIFAVVNIQTGNQTQATVSQKLFNVQSPFFVMPYEKTTTASGLIGTYNSGYQFPKLTANGKPVKYLIENVGVSVGDTIESTGDSAYIELYVGGTKIFTKYFTAAGKLPQDSVPLTSVKYMLDSGQVKFKIVRKNITEGNAQFHIKWREYYQPGLK